VVCSLAILAAALLPLSAGGAEMSVSTDDLGQFWLQIVGPIEDRDDVKFKSMLIDAIGRGNQVVKVSIYSPGGRIPPAMEIGSIIRALYVSTVAPQSVPMLARQICQIRTMDGRTTTVDYDQQSGRGDPRCTCAGACFLIWAAGATRAGDAVQIHRLALGGDGDGRSPGRHARDLDASGHSIVANYLRDMGIPPSTIDRMDRISPDRPEPLTGEEKRMLVGAAAIPVLRDLLGARCGHHTTTSPAALSCENAVIRELYWRGADELSRRRD
jgi:hypothetical protein